jgi:hypothetical protein
LSIPSIGERTETFWPNLTQRTQQQQQKLKIKRLKGNKNPLPWINGTILNLINKKKNSIRQKLKKSPFNLNLGDKFMTLRTEIKRLLRESRENFFGPLITDYKCNPKRFRSVLKHKSKSQNIPNKISMKTASDLVDPPSRTAADNPAEIVNLFNRYFTSVFPPVTVHLTMLVSQMIPRI